jgi:5-methylcytosine-specific restriction endonuclease McrA
MLKIDAVGSKRYWDGTKFRILYQFKCMKCSSDIWKRSGQISIMTGLCRPCACARPNIRIRKRPHEWCYNILLQSAKVRSIPVNLTYEQFMWFTTIEECHYCGEHVDWRPFGRHYTTRGQSKGSNLDRKDSALGYAPNNLVVACKNCNRMKNNILSYEEMLRLAPHIRAIRLSREGQKW